MRAKSLRVTESGNSLLIYQKSTFSVAYSQSDWLSYKTNAKTFSPHK